MTRNGIEYDFKKSPFKIRLHNLTFVFSSNLHLQKFKEKRTERNQRINESLSNRFNIYIESGLLSDLLLYSEIETRGFLILNERGETLCRNKIKLSIEKAT